MTVTLKLASLLFDTFLEDGDAIVWGQACGEPQSLVEALLFRRHYLRDISAFVGSSFSDILLPVHAEHIEFRSMGAIGSLRKLSKAGALSIIPCHVGQIGHQIDRGIIPCDVAFVQVSPANEDGLHSYGVINDYVHKAVQNARMVVAEVNAQMPFVPGMQMLPHNHIDVMIETDRPIVSVERAVIKENHLAIAKHCAQFIDDGCVLQFGIGAVPDAIAQLLTDRRDLGIHSGMVGDSIIDLTRSGALTNATKNTYRGVSVAGAFIGSQALYDFIDNNDDVLLCNSDITHNEGVLSAIPKLVSVNSAIEVSITGAINAESTGGNYVGATGGQVDYVRGANRSPGGRSIIALPAAARGDTVSRIVPELSGPVTTSRSETDIIVTEFGAAQLQGLSLAERAKAMIEIAHPNFREQLAKDAHTIFKKGH